MGSSRMSTRLVAGALVISMQVFGGPPTSYSSLISGPLSRLAVAITPGTTCRLRGASPRRPNPSRGTIVLRELGPGSRMYEGVVSRATPRASRCRNPNWQVRGAVHDPDGDRHVHSLVGAGHHLGGPRAWRLGVRPGRRRHRSWGCRRPRAASATRLQWSLTHLDLVTDPFGRGLPRSLVGPSAAARGWLKRPHTPRSVDEIGGLF